MTPPFRVRRVQRPSWLGFEFRVPGKARLGEALLPPPRPADSFDRKKPTAGAFDRTKAQAVILGYVVESSQGGTGRELIDWYLLEHGGERVDVVASFLDLIAKEMVGIDDGKVVRFRMDHVAQATVVNYVLVEGYDGETVAELSDKLASDGNDGSIGRAVNALAGIGVATVGEGGKVVLGETANTDAE